MFHLRAARAIAPLLLATVSQANPGPGGAILSLAWEAEPRTLDPRYAVDANSQYLEELLHCSLITFDREGHLGPGLAVSWEWTDSTTLKVNLRPKVVFADNTPVTAADVVATYSYFQKPESKAPRKSAFKNLKSITTSGPNQVTIKLQTPDASFVANLAVGILPAALASGPMITDKDVVSGCGPFTLKSASNQAVELAANARYSFGPAPKLQGIILKIVKDENTRYAKLAAGEIDMVQNLISRDKLSIIGRDRPELSIIRRPGLNTSYLGFNMRHPILGNKLVRQAISHAIDKEKIAKYVLDGMTTNADTLLTNDDPFHASQLPSLTYDVEKAKKLLDQAGYPPDASGIRLTLSYKTTTDQTRVIVAKAIASELRRVGIAIKVETLEWGRFKADVDHGRVDLWSLSWVGFKDPDIYRFAFATSSFPPNGGNRGWFSSPALDEVLAAGVLETDVNKRTKIYAEAERIVADEAPYVFLWHEDVFAVVNKRVEGFEVYADGRLQSLARATKE